MKKFDIFEIKMVIDGQTKDEEKKSFFDSGKLPPIHQGIMKKKSS